MSSIGQQFRVGWHYENPLLGWDIDLPAFTCSHCNRCYTPGISRFMHQEYRTVAFELNRCIGDWKSRQVVCRACDMLICQGCAALHVDGECYSAFADAERAFEDKWKQPWMLRADDIPYLAHNGPEPIYRVLDKDSNVVYALQKDVGYTDRQMEALAGDLNYDGSAKRKAGEHEPR